MKTQDFFDSFNAKHKTVADIASTFVPPMNILEILATHNHVLMSGPRGSGKTTLFRMITITGLANWHGPDAELVKAHVDFVSIFVAADRSWHGQLVGLSRSLSGGKAPLILGMSAFTTHIFKAIVTTFMEWQSLPIVPGDPISALIPRLSFEQESLLVDRLAAKWTLTPRAHSFHELRDALSERLSDLGTLRNRFVLLGEPEDFLWPDYLFIDYREGIRAAAELHNDISAQPERPWTFIFDELEVAPSFVQESLFSDLRGSSDPLRINFKLALAPFNKNFRSKLSDTDPAQEHDYKHIDLTFSRKEYGYDFSHRLSASLIAQSGLDAPVQRVFGRSYFAFEDDSVAGTDWAATSKYAQTNKLGRVFQSLHGKDAGFRKYLTNHGIDIDDLEDMDEISMASTLRKIRNIVIIRDYFSRSSNTSLQLERLSSRSRKSFALYAGIPTLLALTEGNPRNLINLMSPLIARYRDLGGRRKISEREQADQIEKSIRILRSLLKTIPMLGNGPRDRGQGLLPFLDTIGRAFFSGVVAGTFQEQPALSFRVDPQTRSDQLSAIGKAVNIGALVYVPDRDSEDVLSNVYGKRFRLCYLLAAYHKLPLSLDREISLTELLRRSKNSTQTQLDLSE